MALQIEVLMKTMIVLQISHMWMERGAVEGAEIRLTQIIMNNFTGEYTGFDEDRNAITDENGVLGLKILEQAQSIGYG